MNTILKYQGIEELCGTSIGVLDQIWRFGYKEKFNTSINKLIDDCNLIHCDDVSNRISDYINIRDNKAFNDYSNTLSTYKLIFNIEEYKSDDNSAPSNAATMSNHHFETITSEHIISSWRIVLMRIQTHALKLINEYLWSQKHKRGRYIQSLQEVIHIKKHYISYYKVLFYICTKK